MTEAYYHESLSRGSWQNYAGTVHRPNVQVFQPESVASLVRFVKRNASLEHPNVLKAVSPDRHTYADGSFVCNDEDEDHDVILIDVSRMAYMKIVRDRDVVEISASMRYDDLLCELDRAHYTLPNAPACLGLSVGGALSIGSHGSGAFASVQDSLASVTVLRWTGNIEVFQSFPGSTEEVDEEEKEQRKKHLEALQTIVGGMDTVGIILSLELRLQPNAWFVDQLTVWESPKMMLEYEKRERKQHALPRSRDYWYWLPLDNSVFYFRRRRELPPLPASNNQPAAATTNVNVINGAWVERRARELLTKANAMATPFATKTLDGLVRKRWMTPRASFETLKGSLQLFTREQPHRNTFYRLARPLSDITTYSGKMYRCRYDCEVFVPVEQLATAFACFQWLFSLASEETAPLPDPQQESDALLRALRLHDQQSFTLLNLDRLQRLTDVRAISTLPVLVRFVPRSVVGGWMAPACEQDTYAFSFSWFGQQQHCAAYERLMRVILDVSVVYLNGRFDWGKYHHVLQLPTGSTLLQAYRRAYEPGFSKQRRAILEHWDPRLIFQNRLNRHWFGFDDALADAATLPDRSSDIDDLMQAVQDFRLDDTSDEQEDDPGTRSDS